jgi:hypothetical protein
MISEAENIFREKKSTNTATQTFMEDIQKTLHNKILVMSRFLDIVTCYLLTCGIICGLRILYLDLLDVPQAELQLLVTLPM